MKAFVTGAAGQVGQDLVRALVQAGHEVHATDTTRLRKTADDLADAPGVAWRHLDVTDRTGVFELINDAKPDVVFHLAGILSARGEQDPQRAYDVNQRGSLHVLEACRLVGVPKLLFTSSIAVYGPGLPDPVTDEMPTRPTTMYGVTKVSTELLGEYYHGRYGLDFRAVRFPGLISASLPGCGTSDYALYLYVEAVRVGGYEAYCRPDTRIPLMYMDDAVRALMELAAADRRRLSRCVYNIAAFSPTAREVADSVLATVPGARFTFNSDPARQAILDSWPQSMDDAPARRDWDWRPRFDLGQMTDDLVPKIRELLARRPDALDDADG
jgi:nucleoside-diphosphate-sugar epimerase